MKKLLLFFIFVVLSSCSIIDTSIIPRFNSVEEANVWVHDYVTYTNDNQSGYESYWYSPKQVIDSRKGDCEDEVNLLLYICYNQFGFAGEHKIIEENKPYIDQSGVLIYTDKTISNHSIAKINGKYYDPTAGLTKWQSWYIKIVQSYTYGESMTLAETNYHR